MNGLVLKHKGFLARITYDEGDTDMHGVVLNVKPTLHFAGQGIGELQTAFADTVEDYIEWCQERGKAPERPYSGELPLRMPSELHRAVATAAALNDMSINGYIIQLIAHAVKNCDLTPHDAPSRHR
jgi:predicted HicB family RNase H-like nuclease